MQHRNVTNLQTPEQQAAAGGGNYSRTPELRVSHKMAERKRRSEMKNLFDELNAILPNSPGSKSSKWEILSKGLSFPSIDLLVSMKLAIDFVQQLKQGHQEMAREIEMLRHELELVRQGGIPTTFPSSSHPHVVYSQGPGQYPTSQPPTSRPSSSQNVFPPATQNGNGSRAEAPPT